MNARHPTSAELARFRRRTALTNKNAGYHYDALAGATRGLDPLRHAAGDADNPFAGTYLREWVTPASALRAYTADRWRHFNRLTNLLSERDALAEVA